MSTISAIGSSGGAGAWADAAAARAGAMKQRMFARADSDGSGSVDKTELQTMLDTISSKTGVDLGSADDLYAKMDANGDGSLDADELDSGMKSLLAPPSSTVEFAQRRSDAASSSSSSDDEDLFSAIDTDGDATISKSELTAAMSKAGEAEGGHHHGHGGPEGPPPGPPPGAGGPTPSTGSTSVTGSSSSSSSTTTDPLDTNGDGVVSAQERLVGELTDLVQTLGSAAGSASGAPLDKSAIAGIVDAVYSRIASNGEDTASSVSLAA